MSGSELYKKHKIVAPFDVLGISRCWYYREREPGLDQNQLVFLFFLSLFFEQVMNEPES